MTTLSRQTQKVFALNANADMLAVFGTMKTGTPVYDTALSVLQSADYLVGWQNAIKADKAPYLEEMNAVQYGLSYQIAYLLQEGVSEYDENTNYSEKSFVKSIINNEIIIYRSLSDDNLGNALTNTTYWKPIFTTANKTLALSGELSGSVTFDPAQTSISLSGAINQSDKIDGQWVYKKQLISTDVGYNYGIPYTYDLSSYLGVSSDSTVQYELLFAQSYYRESSSSSQHGVIYSDVISDYGTVVGNTEYGSMATSSYGRTTGFLGTIPVKTKLYMRLMNAMDSQCLIAVGYRRLGTNQ